MDVESVKRFVKENGIEAEFIEHGSSDGLTSAGAAAATGADISNIIKVLCFVEGEKKSLVIIQGSKRVNGRAIPGMKKPRMASADELKKLFGAEPGGVAAIGLPDEIPKVVDEGVARLPFVIGSGGSRFVGLKIKPGVIAAQPNTVVARVAQEGA